MSALALLLGGDTKVCVVCYSTFTKRQTCAREKWTRQKYCSNPCAFTRRSADRKAGGYRRTPEHQAKLTAARRLRFNSPDAFWAKVNKDTGTGCWLWTGTPRPNGYGRFTILGVTWAIHRYAYTQLRGEIPAGLVLDHLCRVPLCVNPDHLEPVTNRVNLLRGYGWSGRHARQTHCIHGHEFTTENTRVIESRNGRACRTCEQAWSSSRTRRVPA